MLDAMISAAVRDDVFGEHPAVHAKELLGPLSAERRDVVLETYYSTIASAIYHAVPKKESSGLIADHLDKLNPS